MLYLKLGQQSAAPAEHGRTTNRPSELDRGGDERRRAESETEGEAELDERSRGGVTETASGGAASQVAAANAAFDQEWVVRTHGRTRANLGETVRLRIDWQRVHCFDPDSGNNLLKAGRK